MVVCQQFIYCAGCNLVINDRYIFQVDDQKLHYSCLRCSECRCPLDGKCWFKQNNFYCKNDYDRIIQRISCCRVCKKRIEKNTLKYTVDRVDGGEINVHLSCFKCSECDKLLSAGDHFVRRDDRFACSVHFADRLDRCRKSKGNSSMKERTNEPMTEDNARQPTNSSTDSDHHSLAAFGNSNNSVRSIASQPASSRLDPHSLDSLPARSSNHPLISSHFAIHHHLRQPHHSDDYSSIPALSNSMNLTDYPNDSDNFENALQANEANLYSHEYNLSPNDSNRPASARMIDSYWTQVNSPLNEYENLDTHPCVQRKARSKRRKPQSDAEFTYYDLDNSNSSSSSFKQQVRLISLPNVQIQSSNSSSSSSNSSTSGQIRQKRNRTSFKPHQLEAMRALFAVNQNPTTNELLLLSKKTSLSKRVLQVWFQNVRANYRKKNNVCQSSEFGRYLLKMKN